MRFHLALLSLVAAVITSADAQPPQTLNDPTPSSGDRFGGSVAVDGGYIVIGAWGDKTNGLRVGQAHLFDAASGNLLKTFDDPTPTDEDTFGWSVAIDNGNVLVGATGDDTNGDDVGQAHLFDAATGNLLQTFDNPASTLNGFAQSLAIDGGNALIGAWGGSGLRGLDVGQAYLFDIATGSLLQTFDDPNPTDNDAFGWSVAIDGGNVLIGEPNDDTNGPNVGQAHLFDTATGNLLQTFNDPNPSDFDAFGFSVAIDGGNVLIGAHGDDTNGTNAGQAYLFDTATGALLQTFNAPAPSAGAQFGGSVALDGNNVVVGAASDDRRGNDIGQAYLFDAATGDLLRTLNDPTPTFRDFFGFKVALNGDAVVIGAPADDTLGTRVGQAHLFDANERTAGDFSGDGRVDNEDLNLLLDNWAQASVSPDWMTPVALPVDNDELNALLNNWGFGVPGGLATLSDTPTVPEPGGGLIGLLGLTGVCGAPARRR